MNKHPSPQPEAATGAEKPTKVGGFHLDPSGHMVSNVTGNRLPESTPPTAGANAVAAEKLLPCPFCGGIKLEEQHQPQAAVICIACGGQLHSGLRLEFAIERWNRRTAPAPSRSLEEIARETANECSVIAFDKYRKRGVDTFPEFNIIILAALTEAEANGRRATE